LVAANPNKATTPCRHFHSIYGCKLDNDCRFIHDQNYSGKPHPLLRNYQVIKKSDLKGMPDKMFNQSSGESYNITSKNSNDGSNFAFGVESNNFNEAIDVDSLQIRNPNACTVNLNNISSWMDSRLKSAN